jgi:hypothetical protein
MTGRVHGDSAALLAFAISKTRRARCGIPAEKGLMVVSIHPKM